MILQKIINFYVNKIIINNKNLIKYVIIKFNFLYTQIDLIKIQLSLVHVFFAASLACFIFALFVWW